MEPRGEPSGISPEKGSQRVRGRLEEVPGRGQKGSPASRCSGWETVDLSGMGVASMVMGSSPALRADPFPAKHVF